MKFIKNIKRKLSANSFCYKNNITILNRFMYF